MSRYLFLIVIFSVFGCSSGSDSRSLVNVAEVHRLLESGKDLQIIDVRMEDEFNAGHIPMAKKVWRSDIEDPMDKTSGMRIGKRGLAILLGRLGITEKDSIYIYDGKGNVDSARLWWLLKLYGFEKVALIDGGYIQWRMAQYQTEEVSQEFPSNNFEFTGEESMELLATKEQIVRSEFSEIIDARSAEEYNGVMMKNGAIRGGHIPGAVLLDYSELISGGDFTVRPKDEIISIMKQKGLSTGSENTVVYCHSGVRSAYVTFVLREVVGMKNVSNYDGSWIEWSRDESLPLEEGQKL